MIPKAIHSESARSHDVQRQAGNKSPLLQRIALVIGVPSVAAATYAIGVPRSAATTDPDLLVLLSAMVLIKGGVAAAVIAFVFWRLSRPADAGVALAYLLGALPLTASVVWLWSLAQIPMVSLVFYTSLAGLLFVAHVDKKLFDALCLSFGGEGRVARLAALRSSDRRRASVSARAQSALAERN